MPNPVTEERSDTPGLCFDSRFKTTLPPQVIACCTALFGLGTKLCPRFRSDSALPNFARFRVNVLECLFFFLLFYFSSVCVMGLAVAAPTVYHCGEAPRGRCARERTGGDLKEPVPQNLDTHTHVHIHGRSDRSWSSSHTHVCILSSGHFKLFAKSNPGYSCFPY